MSTPRQSSDVLTALMPAEGRVEFMPKCYASQELGSTVHLVRSGCRSERPVLVGEQIIGPSSFEFGRPHCTCDSVTNDVCRILDTVPHMLGTVKVRC